MRLKNFKPVVILFLLTFIMVLPYFVFAQGTKTLDTDPSFNPINMLENVGSTQGPYAAADENSLPRILGLVINGALSLLGIVFIVLMILAGYNWMMASGNEQKVDDAKSTIKRAIIGLVIVLGSWAIWNFLLSNLVAKL